jgi:parallel beta-helix repeat protein
MKRFFFTLLLCCFTVFALAMSFMGEQLKVSFIGAVHASSNTIYVPDNSTTIKGAVNMANPNDTIVVRSGIYPENNIIIQKAVRLIAETLLGAVIDGGGANSTIVNVAASNVEIAGFVIRNGSKGFPFEYGAVRVGNSVDVVIRGNVLTKSYYGLFLSNSSSCSVFDNTILENYAMGIKLTSNSSYNRIIDNTIKNNPTGVLIAQAASQSNVFYHNNFVLNSAQEQNFAGSTVWNNSAEGNYWSNYAGPDANGDGIIDLPYNLTTGTDYFPLVEPWSYVRVYNVLGQTVSTYSNTTVASFYFNQSAKEIGFNVTGPAGETGFVNVTIPKNLLWVNVGEDWTVSIDYVVLPPSGYSVSGNATHTFVYVPYGLSTHRVQIVGTQVVPEFPSVIAPLMFIVATFAMVVLVGKTRRTIKH